MTDSAKHGPRHVAIIMDGNGRWANARGLPRQVGHERGVEALRRTVEACRGLGLEYLTVYSFSTENWKRPASEVSALFSLLKLYVKQDLKRLVVEGVRIRIIGRRAGLPSDIASLIDKVEADSAHNTEFNLNIAFNYGAQDEIVTACRHLAEKCLAGEIKPEDIDINQFERASWFCESPPPELLIRTSGEFRISNFMLWQIAYTELVFMDCLWPDFGEDRLKQALAEYKSRDRRFGTVSSDGSTS